MKCKDCRNFKKDKEMEASKELVPSCGVCRLSGAPCKSEDNCMAGLLDKMGVI